MADALGSISAGPLSITEGQTYTDNISSSSDVDYFKLPASLFAVPSQVNVTFGGSFSSQNNLFAVSVVNQSDTTIATVSSGVPTTLSAPVSAGSAYYLKVAQADSLDTTNYTISYDAVETAESELGSPSVDNGSIQASNYLIDGTSFKGTLSSATDSDWYTFTTGNVDGSTVTLSLAPTASDATFYNLKITDENGTTVSKTGNEALSTTAGSSNGSLSFTVAASTPTEAGTYFVNVEANNTETFASSSEFGNQYTLTLGGTTDYNAPPVTTINSVSSGEYGTTVENDNVYSTVSRGTTTKLSDIISVSDADTSSTPNATISQYIVALQDTTSKTFSISAESDSSDYLFDGKADPTLTLIRGQTYTFDRTDSGHTLQLQETANGTVGTAYTTGVTAGSGGDFTLAVASDAPNTLYYQCASHTAMGGAINIVDSLGTITYTDDTSGATTITAKTSSSGAGFLNVLSAAEFATANYVSATGNDDNQKIYGYAIDNSGVSSVDTNASTSGTQTLTSPNDTSGIVKYRFITSDSGVTISGSTSDTIVEGTSSTNQTLTAALIGTPSANVNIIIDAPSDLSISGTNVSVVDASANTHVLTLNSSTTSDTFTVSAASSANSGAANIEYSTVSTDTAYNALSIPDTNLTVQENIATFTVSEVTYSSSSGYVSEGSSTTGTYTVTANGLTSSDTLELVVSGSGLQFSSATSFNLTSASPSATVIVTADDDSQIEAGSNNDGIHSHAITHSINENGSVSANYLSAIANKSISVADNDDTSSAKSVSISDASSGSSTTVAIPNSVTVNLVDSSAASTSFTTSSGAILASSNLTITHAELGSQSSVYTSDVAISDVVLQLRDIVGLQTLTGAAKEAADVNNDGSISISDVVSSLRDIVGLEAITTFDLIDSSGARVSQVGPSMPDSTLTLVQNGDVDLSGSFIIA